MAYHVDGTGRLRPCALWQLGDSTSPYARGQFYRRWTGAGFGAAPGTEPVCASGVEAFASPCLDFSSAVEGFASVPLDFASAAEGFPSGGAAFASVITG